MPEINIRNNNRQTSDDNLLARCQNIARAYREIGLLTERQYNEVLRMNSVDAINDVFRDIPEMDEERRIKFCKSFVGNDTENFNGATPAILNYAYVAARNEDNEMSRALANKIDEMSADFANSGGMVLGGDAKWPLVDITNIADVYSGFKSALESRMADLDADADAGKIAQMQSNLNQVETVINDYDVAWGLDKVRDEDAPKLERRWDELWDDLSSAEMSGETKDVIKKYNFMDAENAIIPQFLENGVLDKEGRAAALWNLARGDVARRYVATDAQPDKNEIEAELNDAFLFKLYETGNADKIVQMARENPEVFLDETKRAEFVRGLAGLGGDISNDAYNAALDANANAVSGWVARLKAKLGTVAGKTRGFFDKVFRRDADTDRLKNVRMARVLVDKRQKRREICLRILKGFASGFVASVLITTIATAAAATAGISMAASVATIGIVTAIGMGVVQVARWRRRQQDAGLPTDIRAFLADKRLVASLGVSAIAVVAMCFGAAGMSQAAMALGYGALAVGGVKNAVESYRDARESRMSVAESIAWAIANAGAVIAGGFTGRMAANMGINAFNNAHPENTIFQNAETRTVEHTNTTTETRVEYTQDALDNAERIARMWYRDNPEILQQHVDAINVYNVEHGTNIDPYRAIMINGDAGGQTFDNMRLHVNNSHIDPNINDVYSHGHHRVLTDAWGRANGFTHEELNAAARLFNPDGTVNTAGMDVVSRLDGMIGETNTVGVIPARPVQTDGYFKPNDPDGWTTYTDGRPAMVENTYETTETTYENVTDYTRARGDGMAAFGNYNPRDRKTTPRSRIGAWWDKLNDDRIIPVDRGHDDEPKPIIEPVIDPAEPVEPIVPVDFEHDTNEKPIIEPVIEDVPEQKNKDNINFDDIFTAPIVEEPEQEQKNENPFDFVPVNPIIKEENRPDDEMLVAPIVEPEPVIADNGILAITRSQAKSWHDLHARLDKTNEKLQKSPHGSKAAKLRAERSKLQYFINKLRNELGHYDDETIERAAREALLREDLNHKAALVAAGPGANATKWDELDWRGEIAKIDHKIDKKIEKWGTEIEPAARADRNELTYPTPVPGVQRQKKNARGDVKLPAESKVFHGPVPEVVDQPVELPEPADEKHKPTKAERRAARQEKKDEAKAKRRTKYREGLARLSQKIERFGLADVLKRAFDKEKRNDWPGRTYFVSDNLLDLANNPRLIDEPITNIGDAPVYLVDLGGNENPITQNRDVPLVVVDVVHGKDNIKIPFYLETGKGNNTGRFPGHWYPVSRINSNGEIHLNPYFTSDELSRISVALNTKIGDIRNYRDDVLTQKLNLAGGNGFVGGADALQHVDPSMIVEMLGQSNDATKNRLLYGYSDVSSGNLISYVNVDTDWMLGLLYSVNEESKQNPWRAGLKNVMSRARQRFGVVNDEKNNKRA
mgnify:CR=1 FL=1